MDDDYEEFGDDVETLEQCGIDLGEIVLVSTVQGPEIGMLMDTFEDGGIWLKTTHRRINMAVEVEAKEKAALLCEVEKFTDKELQAYARENGMRWTFNKKREFLVDFVFEDLLKDRTAKSTTEVLTKLTRPISMFIPLKHVLRVVSYDEWAEEKTLRETAADLISLEVDED
jgi:hypothetical protein